MQSYLAHIAAADATLRLNESAATRHWLDAAPQEQRGWEWRYLNAQADQSSGIFAKNDSTIVEIAFSSDGQRVAVADEKGFVTLRQADGSELRKIQAHEGPCWRVGFSPDGKWIVTSGSDKAAKLFDATTGEELRVFREFQTPVTGAAFSPDGGLVACGNYTPIKEAPYVTETVKVWDPQTGEVKYNLTAGVKPLSMLRWSPDGKRIAVSSWSGTVNVWRLDQTEPILKLEVPDEGMYTALNCVAWSPDGARVVAGSKDHTARVWDAESGALLLTLRHGGWVTGVAYGPDGKTLATAAHDNLIRTWDAVSGKEKAVLRGHLQGPWAIAFSPDGKTLLSGGNDNVILRWDPTSNLYGNPTRKISPGVYGVAWLPGNTAIVTCAHDGRVRVLSTDSLDVQREWVAHPDNTANTLSLSADGTRLATCSWDQTAKVWNMADGELLQTFTHEQGVYHVAISPDGKIVATAPRGVKGAVLWSVESGEKLREVVGHERGLNEVRFSADGKLLITASGDKTAHIWDVETGSQRAVLSGNESALQSAAFSPDGRFVATSADDGRVTLFDVGSGVQLWSKVVANGAVYRVAFSPDGSRIVCGSDIDPLLDARTGEIVMTLRPHREGCWSLAFSPDGERLASTSTDGTVTICDSIPARERQSKQLRDPSSER